MHVGDGVDGCLVLSPAGSDQIIHRSAIVSGAVCEEVFNDLLGSATLGDLHRSQTFDASEEPMFLTDLVDVGTVLDEKLDDGEAPFSE